MLEFVFVGEHPFTNTLAQRTYGKWNASVCVQPKMCWQRNLMDEYE